MMFRLYLHRLNLYWYLVAARVALPPTNAHTWTFFSKIDVTLVLTPLRVNPTLLVR